MPVYGTCAGMILLADRIANPIDGQESFGGLDVTVQRNAFGGQVESFETEITVAASTARCAAFIRARSSSVGPAARALATLPGGGVVAVRQGNLVATAFHPEVSGETRFHELFLQLVRAAR
jgi:5'-phosphate synthase pdxT subunit